MSAGLTAAAVMFVIVLVVLWTLLPFAIFGVKPLLQTLIDQQKHSNELLARLIDAKGK